MTTGHALGPWAKSPNLPASHRLSSAPEDDPRRSTLRVGMPHLNAGGLSESWLFSPRGGNQHWQALGARWGGTTDDLRSELGARLYPTFFGRSPRRTTRRSRRYAKTTDSRAMSTCRGRRAAIRTVSSRLTSDHNRLRFEMLTMLASDRRRPVTFAQPAFASPRLRRANGLWARWHPGARWPGQGGERPRATRRRVRW